MCKISSEETIRDTTIHIRNESDLKRLLSYEKAIVYRHISGGVANQLSSFLSSILLAEMLHLPLICSTPFPQSRI